jgi:hypothetical protein
MPAGTYEYEKLNPDIYAPPSTDQGDVQNVMWPMGYVQAQFAVLQYEAVLTRHLLDCLTTSLVSMELAGLASKTRRSSPPLMPWLAWICDSRPTPIASSTGTQL